MTRSRRIRAVLPLSTILALMAVMAICHPAMSSPPFPVDPDQTEPVTLRYQYTSSRSDQYTVRFSLRATRSSFVLPIDDTVVVDGTLTFRQALQGFDEAGNAVVFQEVGGLSVSYLSNDQPVDTQDVQDRLAGVIRRLKLDIQGQVLDEETIVTDGLPETLPQVPRLEELWEWLRLELPAQPVAIGDSWVQQYQYSMEPQHVRPLDFNVSATNTFLGMAQVGGTWCALIQSNLEMPIRIDPDQAFDTGQVILGRGTGIGYYYFDSTNGGLVQGEMEFGLVMQTNVPENPLDYTATASLQFQPVSSGMTPP